MAKRGLCSLVSGGCCSDDISCSIFFYFSLFFYSIYTFALVFRDGCLKQNSFRKFVPRFNHFRKVTKWGLESSNYVVEWGREHSNKLEHSKYEKIYSNLQAHTHTHHITSHINIHVQFCRKTSTARTFQLVSTFCFIIINISFPFF